MAAERIGVFGGTFDPPHNGHLAVAVNAVHDLGLDRMLLVVANEPWQKVGTRTISAAADRLAMVAAAVEEVDRLEASDIEIRRGGPSYTADTLEELATAHPHAELFLVLGADSAAGLDTWERTDTVKALARIVVVDRPGARSGVLPPSWDGLHLEVPQLEVSSTELRRRAREGRPLDFLVPRSVVSVIRRHELYGVRDEHGASD
ncbi:MAG: putative nicotinate-nucleotide adenylyltransferase [Acidimicrobiales bacterium]|nr:putative nicotinate-nucleotide adenylyltransferase [Acidimicrobiales bacterium]